MIGSSMLVYLCILTVVVSGDGVRDSKIVQTTQGPVRGYQDAEGGIFEFYGIPYAIPPSESLKFKAPLPVPTWSEPFEAVDKRIVCPQMKSGFTKFMKMQEDCLIANVYVPDTEDTKLPVIVYVHGGAFQIGFGNMLTPKNLVKSKNVIVVTFNYRLGAHGFLCLGTDDAPGNAGMKDQVAALRWVNKNIINFGGNPDDVTIAGYSSGAISVDLLAMSKSAEGLFSKVIIESGSSLMTGGMVMDPIENAKIFAASLGFKNSYDIYALEGFYKAASCDLLTKNNFMDRPNSTLIFAPCIERDIGDEPFLIDAPVNILKLGKYVKVPMLYGFSNMEGLFREPYFDFWKLKMNEKFSDCLPGDLQFDNDRQKEEMAKKVKGLYFKDAPINTQTILSYIDYFGDVMFKYPVLRTVKMHVENGHDKVYLYEYSFVDEDVPVVQYTDVRGATHCAQTFAVLDGKNITVRRENKISKDFKIVKNFIRDFWTNFMKTGTPVPAGCDLPDWPATGARGSPYMNIALPPRLRTSELLSERVRFWDDLYERYYRAPAPPPTPLEIHSELSWVFRRLLDDAAK